MIESMIGFETLLLETSEDETRIQKTQGEETGN